MNSARRRAGAKMVERQLLDGQELQSSPAACGLMKAKA
jgi:hypothetical protein